LTRTTRHSWSTLRLLRRRWSAAAYSWSSCGVGLDALVAQLKPVQDLDGAPPAEVEQFTLIM
jgi:hypothetical protein